MKTILVVDDEEKIRSVYTKMLRREGFNVLDAADAEQANELLLKNIVDLVLLDINMAEVDGTVLYDIAQTFHKKTRVIVASVYPVEDQKTLIIGAADYYDKSEGLQTLIQKVKTAL